MKHWQIPVILLLGTALLAGCRGEASETRNPSAEAAGLTTESPAEAGGAESGPAGELVEGSTAESSAADSSVTESGAAESSEAESNSVEEEQERIAADRLAGIWCCDSFTDGDGDPLFLSLHLQGDGVCDFWVRDPRKAVRGLLESWSGKWSLKGKVLTLTSMQRTGEALTEETPAEPFDTDLELLLPEQIGSGLLTELKLVPQDSKLPRITASGQELSFALSDLGPESGRISASCSDVSAEEVMEFLESPGVNGMLRSCFTEEDLSAIDLGPVIAQLAGTRIGETALPGAYATAQDPEDPSARSCSPDTLDQFLIRTTGYGLADADFGGEESYRTAEGDFCAPDADSSLLLFDPALEIGEDQIRADLVLLGESRGGSVEVLQVLLDRAVTGDLRLISVTSEGETIRYEEQDSGQWFGYIQVMLPQGWEGNCRCVESDTDGDRKMEFYEEPDYAENGSGWLVSLIQVKDSDMTSYQDLPRWEKLGEIRCQDGERYGLIAVYPVRSQATAPYADLYEEMRDGIHALLESLQVGNGAELETLPGNAYEDGPIPQPSDSLLEAEETGGEQPEDERLQANEAGEQPGPEEGTRIGPG